MNDQDNREPTRNLTAPEPTTASQLIHKYNGLVAQAGGIGLTGYRELRVFHDKPTALARIAQLESAIRAHESGERAEAARRPFITGTPNITDISWSEMTGDDLRQQKPREALQSSSNEHTALDTDETETQENEVAKKVKTKKSAKPAKAPRKVAAARASTNGEKHGPRTGSKTEVVRDLLTRRGGCTSREVLDATGWPAVSMPAMAKACGLELRKEKEKGSATQYFGS